MSDLTQREPTSLRQLFTEHPFWRLRREMDDLVEKLFGDSRLLSHSTDLVPSMDVAESERTIEIQTDLPGFKPEEVDIEIHENYLTISGTHTEETNRRDGEKRFHRVERRSGSFSRSVLLPCAVDHERVSAELKYGVLTVTLAKSAAASRQKIAVKG